MLDAYRVALDDRAVKPAVTHRISIDHVAAANLSNAPGAKADVEARMILPSGGRIQVKCVIAMQPLAVEASLDARDLDLAPLKPYARNFTTVALKSAWVPPSCNRCLAPQARR